MIAMELTAHRAVRIVGGLVFVIAGLGKVFARGPYLTPVLFKGIDSPLSKAVWAIERAVPALEIAVGAALMASFGIFVARSVGIGLCVLFAGVLWLLPSGTSCNCFGIIGAIDSKSLHTAVLLLLAGCCYYAKEGSVWARE